MLQRQFTIANQSGLHVRPASVLVNGLNGFSSAVTLLAGGREYNAKSVITVLSACVKAGDVVELRAEGPDENEAMEEAERLILSGLGE